MRCLRFFVLGFLGVGPAPYHGDYRCWSKGSASSFALVALSVPVALIAIGYAIGAR